MLLEQLKQPLFWMLSVCCVTATLLLSLRPAPPSRLRRWHQALVAWLARRPWAPRFGQRHSASSTAVAQLQGRFALGLGLAHHIETQSSLEHFLINQISCLRRELFLDTGVVLPSMTVLQERSLHPFEYSLSFGAKEVARGSLLPAHWLVSLQGRLSWLEEHESTQHPITGSEACWITASELPPALAQGLPCEDGLDLLAHHLRHCLWQNTTTFVTLEFCQQFLAQGLERSAQVRGLRRALESNLPRLASLLQLILAQGGNLRDPARVLFLAGNGILSGESNEAIARRAVDATDTLSLAEGSVPNALSSALLYSYFWNENLSSDLMSRSDGRGLENLAMGMLEVQNLPPSLLEQMWFETLSASESFLLGRAADLGDHLHQILQHQRRPNRLGRSEQTAILLLSLPKHHGQLLTSTLLKALARPKVEEIVQAMGRFGYLLLQAPPGQGLRQLTELGFRERMIAEFLDFANLSSLESHVNDLSWTGDWLAQQRQLPLDEVAYALECYYFPSLDPVTRLRRAVEQDPLRASRALLQFVQGGSLSLSASRRATIAVGGLLPELAQGVLVRLRSRGHYLVSPSYLQSTLAEQRLCQWELVSRVLRVYLRGTENLIST